MSRDLDDLRQETVAMLGKFPADYTDDQVDMFVERRRLAATLIETDDGRPPSVVFVCVHNAGRSQMAVGFAQAMFGGEVTAFGAGSSPAERVNPVVVEAMAELGIDISASFPAPLTDDVVEGSDVVVTMGCGDACPYFPTKSYIDWDLADPHGQDLDAVRVVRDEIRIRVADLLGDLIGRSST